LSPLGALAGFGGVAGETAALPVVVVEPVLAFWARAIGVAKVAAMTMAMMADFISVFSRKLAMETAAQTASSRISSRMPENSG
jgi:hypothetical protein